MKKIIIAILILVTLILAALILLSNSQRISLLEAENKNLRENILVKQDETKQLLIKLINLIISKK